MERVREFRIEVDRPRQVEAAIEGKVERSFSEIDPDQTQPVPLHDIVWDDGTRLAFQKVASYSVPSGQFGMEIPVELYMGELEHQGSDGRKRRSNLTLTTSKDKPVLFTGTRNGFYAYDPLAKGRGDPFYVVGLHVDDLGTNMSRLSAVYHELGHVLLYHTDSDIRLLRAAITHRKRDLPSIKKADAYGGELAQAIPNSVCQQGPTINRNAMFMMGARIRGVDRAISLFHERNAWAAGMNVVRANYYPTGFQEPASYFEYARLCLSSYGRHYRDERFVKGWRK